MNRLALLLFAGCPAMQHQWEAQQAAQAQAQAEAQIATMEQLCKPAIDAYCARCGVGQPACGQTYVACLNGASPATSSTLAMSQVNQCAADISAGDCNVMPASWPGSCYPPTPPEQPQQPDQPQQTCPDGTTWDGNQCACPAGAVWDNTQCVCPDGTAWDGTQCAAVQAAGPRDTGKRCRTALLKRGFQPIELSNCDGVNDRCAVALIGRGFQPIELANCRGVEGKCAETLLAQGHQPIELANCRQ